MQISKEIKRILHEISMPPICKFWAWVSEKKNDKDKQDFPDSQYLSFHVVVISFSIISHHQGPICTCKFLPIHHNKELKKTEP